MYYIKTDWHIPYYNMALEEYLLTNEKFKGNYLFFYVHQPSIIVGSHQNTLAEVNLPFTQENGITVARRISGGGAVYHDEGNLNFSFVFERGKHEGIDFVKYTKPVIAALEELGLDCELSGRNDLLIDGKKFSGNAQYMNSRKILHHGTIMYDVDIEAMVAALNVSSMKIESRQIASVRSRVANLAEYIKKPITIDELKAHLVARFFQSGEFDEYELSREDLAHIEKQVREKFSKWEYNYASKQPLGMTKKLKFTAGIVEASMQITNGILEDVRFIGDFFCVRPVEELQDALKETPYRQQEIQNVIFETGAQNYIAGLTNEELLELMF